MAGLIDYGIVKPELAGAFGAGYRASGQERLQRQSNEQNLQMDQMKLDQLKQDRQAMLQLQSQLQAAGHDPDLNKVFDALIATGRPEYVTKGIEGKQRLKQQMEFESTGRRLYPELFGAPAGNPLAPAAAPAAPANPLAAASAPTGPGVSVTPVAPQAPSNALTMAPGAPMSAQAPVNPLAAAATTPNPAAGKTPEQLRREMMFFSQSTDPRAKAMVEVLKGQLAEATKLHTVGGRLVSSTGQEVYVAPRETNDITDYEYAVKNQGYKGSFTDFMRIKPTAGASRQMVAVNAQLPASEEAQKEFMKETRQTFGALKQAPTVLNNIEEAKKLIPQAKGFMGAGGAPLLQVASFLNNRLGTGIDTKGVESAEELRSRLFLGIMDNLKKLDSQPSQQQQEALQIALGSIGTDPGALPRVLDVFGDTIRQKVQLYNEEVGSAESRGVKFPYNPVIKLPERKAPASAQIPGQGAAPQAAPATPAAAPMYARNPQTGQRIMSTDGGNTWVQAPAR